MIRTPEQKARDDERDAAAIADNPFAVRQKELAAIIATAQEYYGDKATKERYSRQLAAARRRRNLRDYPLPHVFIPEIHCPVARHIWTEKFEGIKRAFRRFMCQLDTEPENVYIVNARFIDEGIHHEANHLLRKKGCDCHGVCRCRLFLAGHDTSDTKTAQLSIELKRR